MSHNSSSPFSAYFQNVRSGFLFPSVRAAHLESAHASSRSLRSPLGFLFPSVRAAHLDSAHASSRSLRSPLGFLFPAVRAAHLESAHASSRSLRSPLGSSFPPSGQRTLNPLTLLLGRFARQIKNTPEASFQASLNLPPGCSRLGSALYALYHG